MSLYIMNSWSSMSGIEKANYEFFHIGPQQISQVLFKIYVNTAIYPYVRSWGHDLKT